MTDYKEKHRILQAELEQDPGNARLINQLAIACLEVLDYVEAFRLLQMNAGLNPGVESWTNLAYFYISQGALNLLDGTWSSGRDKAVELLCLAVQSTPDTEVPWALLGEIFFAEENWDAAKQAFAQFVTIKPGFDNQHNLGSALYQLGQISEAAFYYRRAHEVRTDTYRYLSLYNYVQCQLQLGDYPEPEIAELERALGNPLSEVAKEEMADIYYQRNQFAKVVDAYADTKLVISPKWVLPYYYSLLQCNVAEIAFVVKDKIMNHTAEQRKDFEDDDVEFTWEERQNYLAEIDADEREYLEGFAAIEASGYRPQFTFEPGIETKCHLFGCFRHANADYVG